MFQDILAMGSGGGSADVLLLAYRNDNATLYQNTDYVSVTGNTTITFKKATKGYLLCMATDGQVSGTATSTYVHDRDSYSVRCFSFTATAGQTLIIGGAHPDQFDLIGLA